MTTTRPVMLVILDGFGINPRKQGNAIANAAMPHWQALLNTYPHSELSMSGADVGLPDGFRLDDRGNIWTSAGDGVHCFNASGVLLGKIRTPNGVANVEFGGPRRNRLFICATDSLHSVYLAVNGARRP